MTDLRYVTDGFYITLIPISKHGEYVWVEIAKGFDGVARFPVSMKPSIFKQIKDAGYTIRKAQKVRPISNEELLKFLEV
jgi:hypothetical protein